MSWRIVRSFLFSTLVLTYSALSSQSDSLSLYLFLLDDCPICVDYTSTLNDLYEEYGDSIEFVGYFPNFTSKPEKIQRFKETYGIQFKLDTDYYKTQASRWRATITPEVILYNHSKSQIVYRGRIDNKFVKLGRRRYVVTQHDLRDALRYCRSDNNMRIESTKPVGCYISYNDAISRKN